MVAFKIINLSLRPSRIQLDRLLGAYFFFVYILPLIPFAIGYEEYYSDYSIAEPLFIAYFFFVAGFYFAIREIVLFLWKKNTLILESLARYAMPLVFFFGSKIYPLVLFASFLLSIFVFRYLTLNVDATGLVRAYDFSDLSFTIRLVFLMVQILPFLYLFNVPFVALRGRKVNSLFILLGLAGLFLLFLALSVANFGVRSIALTILAFILHLKCIDKYVLRSWFLPVLAIAKKKLNLIFLVLVCTASIASLVFLSYQGFANKNSSHFRDSDFADFLLSVLSRQATHAVSVLAAVDDSFLRNPDSVVPNSFLIAPRQFVFRIQKLTGSSVEDSDNLSRLNYERIYHSYHPTSGASPGFIANIIRSGLFFVFPTLYVAFSFTICYSTVSLFSLAFRASPWPLNAVEQYLVFAILAVTFTESISDIFTIVSDGAIQLILCLFLFLSLFACLSKQRSQLK